MCATSKRYIDVDVNKLSPFANRLFVDQMLQEASGSMKVDEGQRSESGKIDLLMKFKKGDPEKFKRLQSRFFESNSKSTNKDRDFILEQSIFYKGVDTLPE